MSTDAVRRTGYARMLGLRHIRLGTPLSLALFEGVLTIGFLLALADFVNWWSLVAMPIAVAVMVKLNDLVAGVLARPAAVAQLRRSNRAGIAVGRSPVPRPSRLTTWIDPDDAVPYHEVGRVDDPAVDAVGDRQSHRTDRDVARGVAAVPGPTGTRRSPAPNIRRIELEPLPAPDEPFEVATASTERIAEAGSPAGAPDPGAPGSDALGGGALGGGALGGDTPVGGESYDASADWTGDEWRARPGDEAAGRVGEDAAGQPRDEAAGRAGVPEPRGRGNKGRFEL